MAGRPRQLRQWLAVGRASSPQEVLVQRRAVARWDPVGKFGTMIPICSLADMAGSSSLNAKNLEALGAAKLAELLLSLSEGAMDVMLR